MFTIRRMMATLCCFVLLLGGLMMFINSRSKPGMVVILNGPSAVGKSTIIRSIQAKMEKPWLSLGIDSLFVGVLPPKFYLEDKPEHRSVMYGEFLSDNGQKTFVLHIGQEGQKIINGMHGAIASYAREGNNVIVDYIMYYPEWHDNFMKSLSGVPVLTVGVTADLAVIEERERMRATSPEGHARSIFDTVHNGWSYDLFINTSAITPEQAADQIIEIINKQ